MGNLLRYFFTFLILGMLVYGLLYVVMGLPHPKWMKDSVKGVSGYEIQYSADDDQYTFDPETRVIKHSKQ